MGPFAVTENRTFRFQFPSKAKLSKFEIYLPVGYNLALRRTASQSETLWNYDAALAVDGDPNTCSFTPQSDVQRWWQVHLDRQGPGERGRNTNIMAKPSYAHVHNNLQIEVVFLSSFHLCYQLL